jgi:very-short-patch-repair endonuclease
MYKKSAHRLNRQGSEKCDLSQYKMTEDNKYICNICTKSFPAHSLAIHIKSCHLTHKNIETIRQLYYENVPYKLIRQQGFSKRDLKYALKGCKKRTLSDVAKKSHKDGRAYHWKYKESYPEKFFNKFLQNSGFLIARDYIRECHFSIYRVDFFFPKINLAIEIDGSQHYRYKHQQEIDKRKDEYLRSLDVEVMRVQWKSLFHDSKKVLDNILSILKSKNEINADINIFNKEQLDKFNELNKQQFEMRSKDKNKNLEKSKVNIFNKIQKVKEKLNKKRQKINRQCQVEESSKAKLDQRIKDIERIGQHWGYIAELANLWNVTHTQVRRFIHNNEIKVLNRSELKQYKRQQHNLQRQALRLQHRLLFTDKVRSRYTTFENYICALRQQMQYLNEQNLTNKESVKYLRQKGAISYKEARRIVRHKNDILQELHKNE